MSGNQRPPAASVIIGVLCLVVLVLFVLLVGEHQENAELRDQVRQRGRP